MDLIIEVAKRLERKYGKLRWKRHGEPLDVLIGAILSQNTSDTNSSKAYANLKRKYSYKDIIDANEDEIAKTIKVGGLHKQKAKRIKQILKEIYNFDLNQLEHMEIEEALRELIKFKGVGKKTAAVVLLFGLRKPYFPVDTHISRISRRLGIIEDKDKDPHTRLNKLIPDELKYQLHLHLIRYGREICRSRRPLCKDCVISDLCRFKKEG
jgi:endonuclease-3